MAFWHKQEQGKPLFPDIIWARPENKQYAGKLLVIGGNLHGFSAPATAYNEALGAGIGVARVILPNALERTVSKFVPEAEFAPSTPSGGFSQKALGELLPAAAWSDGVVLAGDSGNNAETTMLFDAFLRNYKGMATLCGSMAEYATLQAKTLANRPQTLLACQFSDLQKFVTALGHTTAITSDMDMLRFVDTLHDITTTHPFMMLCVRESTVFVAVNGQVSTTPTGASSSSVTLGTHAAVWIAQIPAKPFEATTTAVIR